MNRIIFLTLFTLLCLNIDSSAQGCVAIRSSGNTCNLAKPGDGKGWQFNFNNRYFKSYKHFVGTIEQKHREEAGTEVINHTFNWDFTVTRAINRRWSFSVAVPFISNVRSSMYEHAGSRHKTSSFGIGDLRVTAYRWLFDPVKSHRGNIQAGLGIKLPTGDYEYQDYFHKADGSSVIAPVDQSIQLGDGGTGIIAELNGFYNISHRVGFYGNLYYLMNPREQNGVSTARGGTPNPLSVQYFYNTMSVPDQYMARGGFSYMTNKFTFSGGIRVEAIPSSDLVGGDKGFRRPGIVVAAEPTAVYQTRKTDFYISVPVALQRNRTQSNSDKLRTEASGTKVQGDAAFADYAINAGFTVRF